MAANAATYAKTYLRGTKRGAIGAAKRAPDFERHSRKCAICNHPEREAIEELFIHWHNPGTICFQFRPLNEYSLYRHARAAGLYAARRSNLRFVLEHILEQAERVRVNSGGILAALRAYACLTDQNEWVEPAKRVIVKTSFTREEPRAAAPSAPKPKPPEEESGAAPAPALPARREEAAAAAARGAANAAPPAPGNSNRQPVELETALSGSKQTPGTRPNRQEWRVRADGARAPARGEKGRAGG